jgi:GNAT superfamily N-acetyltransferase
MSSSDYTYTVHYLSPSAPNFSTLVQKFSSLRLSALLTSPTSFSSTHALESTFTPAQWASRLSRPTVHIFVAIAHPSNVPSADQTVENGDWVGKVTLLGPLTRNVYELPEAGGPILGPDEEESRWQMTALYTDPTHRGKGLGKKIVKYAIDFARAYKPSPNSTSNASVETKQKRE